MKQAMLALALLAGLVACDSSALTQATATQTQTQAPAGPSYPQYAHHWIASGGKVLDLKSLAKGDAGASEISVNPTPYSPPQMSCYLDTTPTCTAQVTVSSSSRLDTLSFQPGTLKTPPSVSCTCHLNPGSCLTYQLNSQADATSEASGMCVHLSDAYNLQLLNGQLIACDAYHPYNCTTYTAQD